MRIAILGASGLVGRAMLKRLEDRPWCGDDILPLVSSRSAGLELPFRGGRVTCRDAADTPFEDVDLALFSAAAGTSHLYAERFTAAGAWVIDNSSAYRMEPDIALVVPEINADTIPARPSIIANPNCSTIQIVMALAPLHGHFGLREFHCTTLQAVNGAGAGALAALLDQTREALDGGNAPPRARDEVFPRPIAFNAIPQIGDPVVGGAFAEERKVVRESRRILNLPDLRIGCTAVRVPVRSGHGVSLRARFADPVDREKAVELMNDFPGLRAEASPHAYATPAEATGCDDVLVGRLRVDPDFGDVLEMWITADNLLKGAALNAVQIAEAVLDRDPAIRRDP